MQLVNYRLRIALQDGRTLVGQMIAFDKHMNLVLVDCEEFRRTKRHKKMASKSSKAGGNEAVEPLEEKRTLGLLVLRGEIIVSMTIESGPPPITDPKSRGPAAATMMAAGFASGRPVGRGIPMSTTSVPGIPAPGNLTDSNSNSNSNSDTWTCTFFLFVPMFACC